MSINRGTSEATDVTPSIPIRTPRTEQEAVLCLGSRENTPSCTKVICHASHRSDHDRGDVRPQDGRR